MKSPIFNSPLTLVRIVCITACSLFIFSCNSININERSNKVFHINDFNIEKVVGGTQTNSMAYNLRLSIEFKRDIDLKFSTIDFGDKTSNVWILENGVILKKADLMSKFSKGEKVDVYANFSGISTSSEFESIDSTGVTYFEKSLLTIEVLKGRIYTIDLGQPDKITNFLAQ